MCPKFIFCVCVYEIAPIRSPSISQKLELFGNIQIMVLTGFSSFKDIFARKVSVVRWSSHPGKINLLCSIPGVRRISWTVCDSFAVYDLQESILVLGFLVCSFVTCCLGTAWGQLVAFVGHFT